MKGFKKVSESLPALELCEDALICGVEIKSSGLLVVFCDSGFELTTFMQIGNSEPFFMDFPNTKQWMLLPELQSDLREFINEKIEG